MGEFREYRPPSESDRKKTDKRREIDEALSRERGRDLMEQRRRREAGESVPKPLDIVREAADEKRLVPSEESVFGNIYVKTKQFDSESAMNFYLKDASEKLGLTLDAVKKRYDAWLKRRGASGR